MPVLDSKEAGQYQILT